MKAENGPGGAKRTEMRALPLMSQKDLFRNRLGEVDVWLMKLHQYLISEILGKMVEMLRSSFKPNGQEACGSNL